MGCVETEAVWPDMVAVVDDKEQWNRQQIRNGGVAGAKIQWEVPNQDCCHASYGRSRRKTILGNNNAPG